MSNIVRTQGWQVRLVELIRSNAKTQYELGTWDCAKFGIAVVQALCEQDIGAPYPGEYKTVAGYMRILRKAGMTSVFEPFDALFERVAPLLAKTGDLVSDGVSIGCVLEENALFVGEDPGSEYSLVRFPVSSMQWAWKINE